MPEANRQRDSESDFNFREVLAILNIAAKECK
jgi:hypothetical protein